MFPLPAMLFVKLAAVAMKVVGFSSVCAAVCRAFSCVVSASHAADLLLFWV
jgi:hypothetical protein